MLDITGPGHRVISEARGISSDGSPETNCPHLIMEPRQVGIGVHDGLSARIATEATFDFLWLGSFGISASAGQPDNGILEAESMVRVVEGLRTLVAIPLVIDMDTGYGDAQKVAYAVRRLARLGADAVCIEDNTASKRSSLYTGYARPLASVEEHCEKLSSAVDAARPYGCAVIARTEALVAGGSEAEALWRATAYVEAGADAVFVQAVAPDGGNALLSFLRYWQGRTPVFLAPTCYPHVRRTTFFDAGATHYIFANHLVRATYGVLARLCASLILADDASGPDEVIASVDAISRFLGERGVSASSAGVPK